MKKLHFASIFVALSMMLAPAVSGADVRTGTLHDSLVDAAKEEGMLVVWDAGPSVVLSVLVKNLPELRPNENGNRASSQDHLSWILRWHTAWLRNNPIEEPLFACVYSNAIRIVRDSVVCARASGQIKVDAIQVRTTS